MAILASLEARALIQRKHDRPYYVGAEAARVVETAAAQTGHRATLRHALLRASSKFCPERSHRILDPVERCHETG